MTHTHLLVVKSVADNHFFFFFLNLFLAALIFLEVVVFPHLFVLFVLGAFKNMASSATSTFNTWDKASLDIRSLDYSHTNQSDSL